MKRTVTVAALVVLGAACSSSSTGTGSDAGTAGGGAGTAGQFGTGGGGGDTGGGGSGGSGTGGSSGSGTGGSAGGASMPYSSGVSPSAMLSSLSDVDLNKICASMGSYANSGPSRALVCKVSGFEAALFSALFGAQSDAEVQGACVQAISACQTGEADAGTDAPSCGRPTGTCTATVGDLEACVNDRIAAQETFSANLPACSALTIASLKSTADPGEGTSDDPPSCKTFQTKCPGGAIGD